MSLFSTLDAAADKLQALFDKSGTKDNDVVGENGNLIFTVNGLLANDKNAKASTFFFGDGLDAIKQDEYMKAHGITKISDADGGTYRASSGGDFDYSVWTGKGLVGSFSNADVDVLKVATKKDTDKDTSKDKPPEETGNNAAKDDHVGVDHFTFTKADLLANDPGGANKNGNMFFGDTVADQNNQSAYLAAHGITDVNNDGVYEIGVGATDIDYYVQIGNNGTWSKAHVDVDAPTPPPPVAHDGALMANWDFENHKQAGGDNTGTPNGFWNLNQWAAANPGAYGDDADAYGFSGDIQVHGADGHRGLDTAASPGNIFLQAIPEGRGGVLGQGATMPDLVAGKEYHAEVTILKQDYTNMPDMVAAGTDGTDPDAWVSFNFNGTVMDVHASQIDVSNEFVTFDFNFKGIEGEDGFTIMSHGTHDDSQGLIIDQIQVHEWII